VGAAHDLVLVAVEDQAGVGRVGDEGDVGVGVAGAERDAPVGVLPLPGVRAVDAEDLLVDPAALALDVGDDLALAALGSAAALVAGGDPAPVQDAADRDGARRRDADTGRPRLGDRLEAGRDDVDVEAGLAQGADQVALLRVVADVAGDGVRAHLLRAAHRGGQRTFARLLGDLADLGRGVPGEQLRDPGVLRDRAAVVPLALEGALAAHRPRLAADGEDLVGAGGLGGGGQRLAYRHGRPARRGQRPVGRRGQPRVGVAPVRRAEDPVGLQRPDRRRVGDVVLGDRVVPVGGGHRPVAAAPAALAAIPADAQFVDDPLQFGAVVAVPLQVLREARAVAVRVSAGLLRRSGGPGTRAGDRSGYGQGRCTDPGWDAHVLLRHSAVAAPGTITVSGRP